MVKLHLEFAGDADEVARAIPRICAGALVGSRDPTVASITTTRNGVPEATAVAEAEPETSHAPPPPDGWTEQMAIDFMGSLEPGPRQMVHQVWNAAERGIHRRQLCQRTGLTPSQLHGLLVSMGHAVRRFQRDRRATLSRPVMANTPLQTYFINADFAAVATSRMFGDEA